MILLGLLAGYFTLFIGGCGLAMLIMSCSARINIVEYACLAWLLGVAIISLLWWLSGTVVTDGLLHTIATRIALLPADFSWRRTQRTNTTYSSPWPRSRLYWHIGTPLLLTA